MSKQGIFKNLASAGVKGAQNLSKKQPKSIHAIKAEMKAKASEKARADKVEGYFKGAKKIATGAVITGGVFGAGFGAKKSYLNINPVYESKARYEQLTHEQVIAQENSYVKSINESSMVKDIEQERLRQISAIDLEQRLADLEEKADPLRAFEKAYYRIEESAVETGKKVKKSIDAPVKEGKGKDSRIDIASGIFSQSEGGGGSVEEQVINAANLTYDLSQGKISAFMNPLSTTAREVTGRTVQLISANIALLHLKRDEELMRSMNHDLENLPYDLDVERKEIISSKKEAIKESNKKIEQHRKEEKREAIRRVEEEDKVYKASKQKIPDNKKEEPRIETSDEMMARIRREADRRTKKSIDFRERKAAREDEIMVRELMDLEREKRGIPLLGVDLSYEDGIEKRAIEDGAEILHEGVKKTAEKGDEVLGDIERLGENVLEKVKGLGRSFRGVAYSDGEDKERSLKPPVNSKANTVNKGKSQVR